MANLTGDNLDVNTPIIEAADGSIPTPLIATKYFEDYLFRLFADLVAINNEVTTTSVTNAANLGAGVGVFAQKNSTILGRYHLPIFRAHQNSVSTRIGTGFGQGSRCGLEKSLNRNKEHTHVSTVTRRSGVPT